MKKGSFIGIACCLAGGLFFFACGPKEPTTIKSGTNAPITEDTPKVGKAAVSAHYKHIPDAAISGHNTKHLSNVSVHNCMEACDNESWCTSFDYYKGEKRCDLSDKKAGDVDGLKTDYDGNPYDHYEKQNK